jgi:hypothetical protein
VRFPGRTPLERHPVGDDLLHVLEGAVVVTVLDATDPVQTTIAAGSIVPRRPLELAGSRRT